MTTTHPRSTAGVPSPSGGCGADETGETRTGFPPSGCSSRRLLCWIWGVFLADVGTAMGVGYLIATRL